jgi:hypothetical protein
LAIDDFGFAGYRDRGTQPTIDNEMKLSFCTTVMNRLKHLQQTYPHNLEKCKHIPNLEFVLLNFYCNQGTDEWVKTHLRKYISSGQLKYFHEREADFFHLSIAKNLAHRLSTGTILGNLDADSCLPSEVVEKILEAFEFGKMKIATGGRWMGGMPVVRRNDFLAVNGYDETFMGWGYEEIDLYHRILRYRRITSQEIYVYKGIHQIRHGHRLRMVNMKAGHRVHPFKTNQLNSATSAANISDGKLTAKPFSSFVVYKNLSEEPIRV